MFIKFDEAVIRKDVKMEPEMKVKFCEKLNTLIASKKENNSFVSKEKFDMLIQQINTLNNKTGERYLSQWASLVRKTSIGRLY